MDYSYAQWQRDRRDILAEMAATSCPITAHSGPARLAAVDAEFRAQRQKLGLVPTFGAKA